VGDKTIYKLLNVEVVILLTATLQFMDYGLLRMLFEDTFKFEHFSREALLAKKLSV
jgi:hypothetical protein